MLSEEAQRYVKYGSAEVLVFEAVPPEGTTKAKLQVIEGLNIWDAYEFALS